MKLPELSVPIGDSGANIVRIGKVLIKCGTHDAAERIRIQSRWLRNLPDDVKNGFPRIYGLTCTKDVSILYMENLNMVSLREELFGHRLAPHQTDRLIRSVLDWIMLHMYSMRSLSRANPLISLISHVRRRHDYTLGIKDEQFRRLISEKWVRINGQLCYGGDHALGVVEGYINRLRNHHETTFFLHGDLHTGNILVGDNKFKLIDPRGDFPGGGVFFDISYDIGKLLHDVHAGYSLICNGNFDLEYDGDSIDFSVKRNREWDVYNQLYNSFQSWLNENEKSLGVSTIWERSFLVEGLILCGIVPFHIKHRGRALALYVSGLLLLTRWIHWAEESVALSTLFGPVDRQIF